MYRQPPRLADNPTPAEFQTYALECITHLAGVMDDDRKMFGEAINKQGEEIAALRKENAQLRQFAEFEKQAPMHKHAPHGQAALDDWKWKRLLFVLDNGGWLNKDFDPSLLQRMVDIALRFPAN